MPTDETRRVLKVFGVAVTAFEDAVDKGAAPEELRKAEAEVKTRLEEITVLIEQLRAKKNSYRCFCCWLSFSQSPFNSAPGTPRADPSSAEPFWAKGIR